jgi:SPP1 family predicted phage head-tail adaptor
MILPEFALKRGERANDIPEQAQYYKMYIGNKKTNQIGSSTMTRRADLYAPTTTSDGEGGYTTAFTLQETVWGDFRPARSIRTLLEDEKTYYQDAKLFIRYGTTINEEYQVYVEGKMYTIQSINDVDNAHRFLEINFYG